ncbi:hypothetical protein [Mycobacterium sp. BK086]|uniref:zinc finger domain-containing protein n=1 Tax=Mycobacterium sp. BK086 TaxID=2512165 RepID=UPI00105BB824|nr:hypothetical protein [Mycobacterium sp. BK086]
MTPADEEETGLPARAGALLTPFGVPCAYCSAVAGERCRNLVTGKPLRRALAHPARIIGSLSRPRWQGRW